jgi:NADPH:quinone reductase-like Zn-dependent oxidoreductase
MQGNATMRAWEIKQFGLDNLRCVERPMPQVGPNDVRLRVRAAALNSRDLQVIANQYDPNQRLPIVPASDGVGEVVEVGSNVSRVRLGDRVLPIFAQRWIAGERTWDRWASHVGGHFDGMLQEYCVLPAEGLCHVPAHLTDLEAAASCAAAATAWQALIEQGKLHAGQTVLVQGTGGVSMFALQFAKMHGARVVATSSSDQKLARVRELGANDTINYRTTPNCEAAVLDATHGDGVDHIVDVVGDLERAVSCLRVGGLISLIGYLGQLATGSAAAPKYEYRAAMFPVLLRNVRMQGITTAPRESYERMLRAIEEAKMRPVIDSEFEFDAVPAALARLGGGNVFGKVCVSGSAN